MKKRMLTALIAVLLLAGCNADDGDPASAANSDTSLNAMDEALVSATGSVSVWLTYTAQDGTASNQFAIWVEDAAGNYITTLYATSFTAEGGYALRENSLPTWVAKSGLSSLPDEIVDAFTGATPSSGDQGFTWDLTDDEGESIAAGDYVVLVEASLRGDNRVVYTAPITVGEGHIMEADVTADYFGDSTDERGMISEVSVTYSLS